MRKLCNQAPKKKRAEEEKKKKPNAHQKMPARRTTRACTVSESRIWNQKSLQKIKKKGRKFVQKQASKKRKQGKASFY